MWLPYFETDGQYNFYRKGLFMYMLRIILFSLLLFTSVHASGTKWQKLKPVHLYLPSAFHLKTDVKCLVMKTCMTKVNKKVCEGKSFTSVNICKTPLIKRFQKLEPKAGKEDNIRKKVLPNSITNGFGLDEKSTIWRLNEVEDILNVLGEIDTEAEAQFALWLYGKPEAKRYKKTKNGYEMRIERENILPCDGKSDYKETVLYQTSVNKKGKIGEMKLLKRTKQKVEHNWGEVKKPALYLYPQSRQKIDVSLNINGEITTSIPSYNQGWSVMVERNGTIENRYDYLFYENTLNRMELPNEGWIVEGSKIEVWFDNILPKLGLNKKEMKQFKAYWLEKLDKNRLYEVKLLPLSFLKKNMRLTIDPKPDTLIRVIFSFRAITEPYEIEAPKISTLKRAGFHALEWGGLMIDNKEETE